MNGAAIRSGAKALNGFRRFAARILVLLAIAAGAGALLTASVGPAEALPSYARQTGQPCAACHTAFPELTPFGRRFKIGGYTLQGGDWNGPPIAAMFMAGFTHTNSPQDAPPASGLHTNDNLLWQQVSGFVAGRLYGNLGSFIQITGDPVGGTVGLDASDLRYADTFKLFGQDTIWGIDVNNAPTVEDPWNTTPSWSWPQISSTIAPAFGPPSTRIEGGYTATVGGVGPYIFWNDMLYAAVIAYKGFSVPELQAMNVGNSTTDAVTNVAPYWRVALEPHWGSHYLMVGTFGMYGQIAPGRQYGIGTDNFLDVGVDAQYQYDGDQYSVTVKLADIMEWQQLNATYFRAGSSNLNNTLNSFKANASSVWITHTASASAISTSTARATATSTDPAPTHSACRPASVRTTTASTSSPNGNDLILDFAYIPFARSPGSPRLHHLERPHRPPVSPSTCTFTAARTISTACISVTHNAAGNICCSPMRGWRSRAAALIRERRPYGEQNDDERERTCRIDRAATGCPPVGKANASACWLAAAR